MEGPAPTASGKKRRLDPVDKQERILTAAREVLTEKSFDEASVSEIVKKAGVAQGTFYRYFPSKTHLVSVLAERVNAELVAEIEAALGEEDRPLAETLGPLARAASRVMERNKDILAVVDTEALLFTAPPEGKNRRESYCRLLASAIERDKERGLLDPEIDPYVAARLAGRVIDRLARDIVADDGNVPRDRYLAQAVAFLRRALGVKA